MTQNPRPNVLVIDDDPAAQDLISAVLSRENYEIVLAGSGQEALNLAQARPPDLAVLDIMLPGIDGYTVCRQLRQNEQTRSVPILMLTAKSNLADKIAGFEAGADDYITKPFHPAELTYRVRSLLVRGQRPVPASTQAQTRGRIITFFSTKGGVGKTVLSANLAMALQSANKRVALFDADFFFGDIGVHLNLTPSHSVLDLIRHIDELDQEMLNQVMITHSSGLRALLSPFRPEQAELISPEHIRKLLSKLAEYFDFVIVDSQASYEERTITVLECSDDIMLVTMPEIGPLKNMRLFLDVAARLGLPSERFHVLLNRYDSNVGIKPQEIERALQCAIQFRIASGGRSVVLSANRGVPLVVEQPAHPLSRQISQMAEVFLNMRPLPARKAEPTLGAFAFPPPR